jgi:beta-RFAP synthase
MGRVRVQTPSRLHFGLLGWGPAATRQFGGLGLMIDRPGLELTVESAPRWEASGPLAARSLEIARSIFGRLAHLDRDVGPVRIVVRRAPKEHVGLGVGTQLSLALGRALTRLAGLEDPDSRWLAGLTGRGLRSGVGLHGFDRGGFIVDGGRRPGSKVPPLLVHRAFPDTWSVLVVIPGAGSGLHGPRETQAFRSLTQVPEHVTDRLCRLVLLGVLPALVEQDLRAFGGFLEEIQAAVGSQFAPVQGGLYAHPDVEALAVSLRSLGLVGVGQSSWGPTLYGLTDGPAEARAEILRAIEAHRHPIPCQAFWTTASRAGATCEWLDREPGGDGVGVTHPGTDPHP